MPETYGQPEDEPTRTEKAAALVTEIVAGQGIVRRITLYCVAFAGMGFTPILPWDVLAFLLSMSGLIALVLLSATDRSLS